MTSHEMLTVIGGQGTSAPKKINVRGIGEVDPIRGIEVLSPKIMYLGSLGLLGSGGIILRFNAFAKSASITNLSQPESLFALTT